MWTPSLDNLRFAEIVTGSSRSLRSLSVSLLVLAALGTVLLDLGHDHSEGDILDGDHCGTCQAYQSTLLPDTVWVPAASAAPKGDIQLPHPIPERVAFSRLGPPRRGPPSC